jgi:glucose/arabinose dehydrogenase
VDLQAPRLDPHRLFVVEQEGRIRVIRSGTLLATPFLDIDPLVVCCGERGFLGLAFHPDYEENGLFFVNYTNNAGHTTIARYRVDAGNPDVADPTSAKILLVIGQPFVNHNAGQLAFGPDGYLYLGMGDGGGGGDPLETAQDDTNLLGKMLRLDVDVDAPPWYAVPPSNPHYDDGSGLLELIWAKGFRNPWRYSFDRDNGDLYVADVGQDAIEEIDFQPAASTGGENYGWDVFEGTACFEPAPAPFCPVPPSGFRFPVHQYSHPAGCSVTGGYVYRGCALPSLRGTYFYSDFCTSFVRTFRVTAGAAGSHANRTSEVESSGVTLDNVTSFGQDARGELYVVDLDGDVLKIVPQ